MKIAYLARALIPSRDAMSIHIMRMCRAFAEDGHDVQLLTPALPGTEAGIEDLHGYYGVAKNFEVIRIPWWGVKGSDLIYSLSAVRRCRRLGVQVAYGRHLEGCWAAAVAGLPVVFETHSSTEHLSWLRKLQLAALLQRTELRRLVVISEALKRYFVNRHNVPPSRILVAHDAADPPPRYERLRLGGGNALRVGYAGHLYPGKGMEVIEKLVSLCTFAEFHVIGGRGADLAHWQSRLGTHGNLKFHGFVEPARVAQYLQSMDVLLAPFQRKVMIKGKSDVGQWMSPLKVFEYMAARRPMVISDLPVLREVVNERNAIIVSADDPDQWRQALVQLQDPVLRERLAEAAHEDFLRSYTWTARAQAVLRCL